MWSFGEEAERVIRKFIDLRYRLKPYITRVMTEAHENGSPAIRPLFFNFSEDEKAWNVEDQYCFGGDILVAPIFEYGARERTVYLPKGVVWINAETGVRYEGGQTVTAEAPVDVIPVFACEGSDVLELLKGD